MYKKFTLAATAVLLISSCSEPVDYSGMYIPTEGENCSSEQTNDWLIKIERVGTEQQYRGSFNPRISEVSIFPQESGIAPVDDAGSLTLVFQEKGEMGWVSSTPNVKMQIELHKVPGEYDAWIKNWNITTSPAERPSDTRTVSLVENSVIQDQRMLPSASTLTTSNDEALCLKNLNRSG